MRHAEARTLRVFAINPRNLAGHTDRGSHRGARQIHNRLTRFSSHLISYFYHRAPLRCGATRAYHQRPAQGGLALAPADKDQRRGPPQRPQQPFLFPPYSLCLSSSSATLRRHSRIPSATRSSAISSGRQSLLGSHGEPLSGGALGAPRHDVRGERQEGLPSHPPKRTNGADRRSDHSSNTKYNNEHSRQLAHRAKRREKRTQRPVKTTSSIFCGAP